MTIIIIFLIYIFCFICFKIIRSAALVNAVNIDLVFFLCVCCSIFTVSLSGHLAQ